MQQCHTIEQVFWLKAYYKGIYIHVQQFLICLIITSASGGRIRETAVYLGTDPAQGNNRIQRLPWSKPGCDSNIIIIQEIQTPGQAAYIAA